MSSSPRQPLTAPSLVGRHLYLRATSADDIANTHHWILLSEPQSLSAETIPIESAAAAADLYKKSDGKLDRSTLMLVRRDDNLPVARVDYFNVNHQNRSVEFVIVVDPDVRRNGHAAEGVHLLCRYLFEQRGFNKVHTLVAESNHAAVGLLEKLGFRRDGTLRQHFYFDGEYRNALLFSLLRFEFV